MLDIQILDSREKLRRKIMTVGSHKKRLTEKQINRILDSYSELWRYYHNNDHILNMFALFELIDTSQLTVVEIQAIQFMIIFHDDMYKLGRAKGWNEQQSANWALFELGRAGYRFSFATMVYKGIIASTTHSLQEVPAPWHVPIAIFLDIDLLAGLGKSWKEFSVNTTLIQKEFEPMYSPEEYRNGRASWAASMLAREKIFLTPHFAPFERIAQENLSRLAIAV